jgi:hypothetical protein
VPPGRRVRRYCDGPPSQRFGLLHHVVGSLLIPLKGRRHVGADGALSEMFKPGARVFATIGV